MNAPRRSVLIVEDEDLARERLARLVRARADFELVGACRNSAEALAALERHVVDIALVDIEMPGLNGLELLRRAGASAQPPLAILTTAHPRFAVDAFAAEAVDYLLKPFDAQRLDAALQRACERLHARAAVQATRRVRAVIDDVTDATPRNNPAGANQASLIVHDQSRLRVVRAGEIDWIQAQGRRCIVHCGNLRYGVDGPLARIGARLPALIGVSRCALVNAERVTELQEMFKGNLVAVLRGGAQVPVSRRFRAAVLARLGG